MLVGFASAREPFFQIGLGRHLIENTVRICDSGECQRERRDPNRLCNRDVISMNSLQQTLPASDQCL